MKLGAGSRQKRRHAKLESSPPQGEHRQEPLKKKLSKEVSVEDTFHQLLAQVAARTELKAALLDQLKEQDHATQPAFTHDIWQNFPTVWVRICSMNSVSCLLCRMTLALKSS